MFRRAALLVTILASGAAALVAQNETRHEEPLLNAIRLGMTYAEVQTALTEYRPDLLWSFKYGRLGREAGYSCFPLGSGTCLNIKYGNLRDEFGNIGLESTVEGLELTRCHELNREIPEDLFDAVLMIHTTRFLGDFDPVPLIRAVNTLLPLGKEKALKALRTYDAVATKTDYRRPLRSLRYDLEEERILLICRLLFVRKDGSRQMPHIGLGVLAPIDVEENDTNWPLFPLVIERGIPFSLSLSYSLGGYARSPREHLGFFEANCVLRDAPLVPDVSPIEAVDAITESRNWTKLVEHNAGTDAELTSFLRTQAVRCIARLYKDFSMYDDWELVPRAIVDPARDQHWRQIVAMTKQKTIKWDEKNQAFVLRD